MPNTLDKNERRLSQQEISVIRVCSQLLKTVEYSDYLTRDQILDRMISAYHDLLEYYIGADAFVLQNFDRYEKLRYQQIYDYYCGRKYPKRVIKKE